MIDLTPEDLSRLTELLHEHGGIDGVAQAAAAGAEVVQLRAGVEALRSGNAELAALLRAIEEAVEEWKRDYERAVAINRRVRHDVRQALDAAESGGR